MTPEKGVTPLSGGPLLHKLYPSEALLSGAASPWLPHHSGACQGYQTQASSWEVPTGVERRQAGAAFRSLVLGQAGAPSVRQQVSSCPLLGNFEPAAWLLYVTQKAWGHWLGLGVKYPSVRILPAGWGPTSPATPT